jgi:2,3-dihydroxybenzoate-AMP ligase
MPTPISDHTVPWPDAAAADYVAKGYWAGAPLGALLRDIAYRRPGAPALVDDAAGLRMTHRQLADRADAAAARLLGLGMSSGDRIVVQLGNSWEFVVLTLACLRVGIVPVTALPAHRRTELAYLARHAEATAMAVPDHLRDFDHQTLAHDLAVHPREVRGSKVDDEEVVPAPLDPGMGPGDEGLVDLDVGLGVAPHDHPGRRQGELDGRRPVGRLPDEARGGSLGHGQGALRRDARGATAGPSLLKRVASLTPAAAR